MSNYNFGARLSTSRSSNAKGKSGNNTTQISYGRVTDIVIDAFHPLYEEKGKSQALNGVEYIPILNPGDTSPESAKQFAYCGSTFFKRLPLKNEIVTIIGSPASEARDFGATVSKNYWLDIVPVWNHTHHNAYPDTDQDGEGDADLGKHFEEQSNVNNLQLFPGDVSIESRHGSSIRLGGTKFDSNELTDSSNNMKPFTIIRNGQLDTDDGVDLVLEDINKDASSIYLTSDHKIELEPANEKRDAFESEPETSDTYKGKQIILNSGRLYFNSYDEGAYISAKDSIGFNAKEIAIDGEDYIGLDAKKIYLGTNAFNEDEPVLLGQTTIDWLEDITSQVETIAKTMATLPPAPPAAVAKLIATGNSLFPQIKKLKSLLKPLLSKKSFTE